MIASSHMKAAMRGAYGPPEVLTVQNTQRPIPKDNEILVRVHAATVNRTDCGILLGKPYIVRFFTGLRKPKLQTTGTDFAGVVEAAGQHVSGFHVGDRVWGFDDNGLASHAEYLAIPQNKAILKIPEGISFAQAAASAEGAHYAINFINKVNLAPTQKVLVNGATGAIGSAALQFLKFHGLYVAAVCGTDHVELIQSLGADKVIDYQKEDFTKDDDLYDFVFDAVGKSTFGKCKPILRPRGVYISSELGPRNENPFLALITPLFGGKQVRFPLPTNIPSSLSFIQSVVAQGKFKPLIDRTYPLEQIGEAFQYVVSGQKTGNVILAVAT